LVLRNHAPQPAGRQRLAVVRNQTWGTPRVSCIGALIIAMRRGVGKAELSPNQSATLLLYVT
jgi:hypothetical protein